MSELINLRWIIPNVGHVTENYSHCPLESYDATTDKCGMTHKDCNYGANNAPLPDDCPMRDGVVKVYTVVKDDK